MKDDIKFEIKKRKNSIKIINRDNKKEDYIDEIIVSNQGRNLHTGVLK